MTKHTFFFLLLVLTVMYACTKPPDFPIEPVIEFGKIENNIIRQEVDSAFVTINFTDGDGDIGFLENEQDLFITDTRQDFTSAFVIPMTPELGSENGISGEIRFPITGICCIEENGITCRSVPDQQDTVVYTMYIEDRAGNKSNIITLEPIYLLCE